MTCTHCQRENPEDAAFCAGCGRPLALVCPSCERSNPPDAAFCNGCGQALGRGAAPAPPEREPRDYTPKHLADKILQSKSALEGERKQVTVLFADVKGSMELAEGVDPEEWHRILDRFFQILADGVHRFEGTVNQYTGDGIMALFGAPIAHEDHAQRACWAALRLCEELRRYADELRVERGLSFAVRMGLNSGEVVVGKIGDDLRMDYTAQGPTVGLAARMEQIAEPGKVYLTQHTARLVEGFFRLRDLGQSQLKGIREPLRIHELEGTGPMRTRLEVARARGLSRFVGRADEMTSLELALQRASQDNAQVVGVVGEAGVGKSRLCLEFAERCRAKGTAVYEAHCPAHGKNLAFLPLLELLRNLLDISEHDSDQKVRETIAGRLLLLDRGFEESLALVFDFLGVPDPENPAPRMDPGLRQRRLFGFVRRLVQRTSAREPAILLVDDLHWIDPASDAFLAQIVEAVSGTRTMLLLNFRPEYHAEWTSKSHYQQLPLAALGREAIQDLLRHLLGEDPSVAGLHDLIHERTRGNPFFIEELVQSLAESGSLAGELGSYKLTRRIEALEIPATVQSVLAARIDRLPEREKQLLQTAAVIGKKFPESVLRRVVGLSDDDLAACLSALRAAEFVYEEALYPQVEYSFRHPLTQEVAYHSQLSEGRARVHAAVARALQEVHADKLDEHAALLAHHWEAAGEALEAAHWHRRAAEWAGFADPAEAARHWRKVLALLEEVPESSEKSSFGLRARIWLLRFGWRVGMAEQEVARLFAEGKALAERAGDVGSLARVIGAYGQTRVTAGAADESLECALEATRLAEAMGDTRLRINLLPDLAYALLELGRLAEAQRVLEEGLELTRESLRPGGDQRAATNHVRMLIFRADARMFTGSLGEADRDLLRAVELARERGELELVHYALGLRGWLAGYAGKSQGSRALAREAMEIAERLGAVYLLSTGHFYLGVSHFWNREWEEAAASLERCLTIARQIKSGLQWEVHALGRLAEAYLGLGDNRRARATADEAVALARHRSVKLHGCVAHLALARVLLRTQGAAASGEIRTTLREALTFVEETGGKVEEPFIRVELAELARLTGDETTRERELRQAQRLFGEMGATGHAERLAKELGL